MECDNCLVEVKKSADQAEVAATQDDQK